MIGENATSRPAAKHFPRSWFFFYMQRTRGGGEISLFFFFLILFCSPCTPIPTVRILCAHARGSATLRRLGVYCFAGKFMDRNLAVRVQSGSTFNLSCGRESPLLTSKWLKSGPGGGREAITILVCVPQSVQPFQAAREMEVLFFSLIIEHNIISSDK